MSTRVDPKELAELRELRAAILDWTAAEDEFSKEYANLKVDEDECFVPLTKGSPADLAAAKAEKARKHLDRMCFSLHYNGTVRYEVEE